jgi:hypothetical protein
VYKHVADRLLLDIEIIQPSFGSASVSNPVLKMSDSTLLYLPFLRQWGFRVWDLVTVRGYVPLLITKSIRQFLVA